MTHPRSRAVGRPIAFRFDGRTVLAQQGETIAAALAAEGTVALRHAPSGAPRGLHCGMGACYDCVVTIDGRGLQRACVTKAAHGMEVSGQPPAIPAPLAAPPAAGLIERACDVLVIGAGPAGLSAAIAAAEAGASVILLDERDAPGGQYAKPLAPSQEAVRPDAQHRLGAELAARAEAAGVVREPGSIAWGAFAPDEITVLVRGIAVVFHPKALVLATGAHERPVPLPGWTLPGVMTTGGLQGLARSHRVSPGRRVLVAGSGPLNLQLACELHDGGAHVVGVVEAASPGIRDWRDLLAMARTAPDLLRDGAGYLARLAVARVPVMLGSVVRAYEGEGRVQAAIVATPRGTRRLLVDAVGMNMGFAPETGLARALRARHRVAAAGHLETETDQHGATSVPGVFAVGDGAALGGARIALARGRLAGLAAARHVGCAAQSDEVAAKFLARATAFQGALWRVFRAPVPEPPDDDTIVCRCEEITAGRIRAELAVAGSLPALKRATRAGMGPCQGRFCATTILGMCAGLTREEPGEAAFSAPRAPIRPVPAAAFMIEAPEFSAPLVTKPGAARWTAPFGQATAADRQCDVAVIGGGVVGLTTALALAREGLDVLVLDRAAPAMAASTANAGSLHAQLLAYDVDPDDPARETPAVHALPLGPRAIRGWQAMAAECGDDLGLVLGGLMLAAGEPAMRRLRAKASVEARFDVESHVIGPAETARLMPHAAPMAGAVYCPVEGRIDPLRATFAVLRLAQAAGVRLPGGAEVTGLAAEGAGWRIDTSSGPVRAGRVVIAAGAGSARIAAFAGLDLPVRGTVQQVIVTEPAPPMIHHLVAVADRHLSLKQQANGSLLIGGGWFGDFDPVDGATRNLRSSIQGNLWVTGSVLPALSGLHMLRAWTGLAPSVDGAPILGEVPGCPGLFTTVGVNGLTLAPAFAEITAEAMRGHPPDPRLRLERFA